MNEAHSTISIYTNNSFRSKRTTTRFLRKESFIKEPSPFTWIDRLDLALSSRIGPCNKSPSYGRPWWSSRYVEPCPISPIPSNCSTKWRCSKSRAKESRRPNYPRKQTSSSWLRSRSRPFVPGSWLRSPQWYSQWTRSPRFHPRGSSE